MSAAISSTALRGMYQPPPGGAVWHTVRDAAEASGVSTSTVRRALARHGAKVGRTVCGMVRLSANGRAGYVPVSVMGDS